MSTAARLQNTVDPSPLASKSSHAGLLLQRKCACGGSASSSLSGECAECSKKKLQRKLSIGASNDPLEQKESMGSDSHGTRLIKNSHKTMKIEVALSSNLLWRHRFAVDAERASRRLGRTVHQC